MELHDILKELKIRANPHNVKGMTHFGINPTKTYGIAIPVLRDLAKKIGKDHALALQLWKTGIHEAHILAGMIDDPQKVTKAQMLAWAKDFDSWDVCDQVCMNLFSQTANAYGQALEWASESESGDNNEFIKRAGFALMACLAWNDKGAPNSKFNQFFPAIKRGATDQRNYVKKAVNWALRQIGKRNSYLRNKAITTAKVIKKIDSKSAKWVATDALRELTKVLNSQV